ncbi:hypothetical protein [Diaphorobacter aerolatus]|uniref:Uncharacterized protein n=1 Tax=Diaphorobacter aerolatus TaxID=1288495 RepID=A0A7H0GM99_9BURK|nr:hypothetical protein [Diaphorobacter aerolatus]QNP49415.1 hypothetical protein H9K75_05085 [Diaphorobacter aerolatus]
MSSQNNNAFKLLLGLSGDWNLHQIRLSRDGSALELLVGRVKKVTHWFGKEQWENVDGPRHAWRHLDFGGMPTYVHAVLDGDEKLFEQTWAGPRDQAFTRAMASYLVELLCSGADLGSICKLHRIDLDTLWRFRFSLDRTGGASLPVEPAALQRLRSHESTMRQMALTEVTQKAAASSPIPGADSPIWTLIGSGEAPLQTNVFALRLLLARLRTEVEASSDEATRRLKCAKLHRYFTNNATQLADEINQLKVIAI